MLQKDLSKHKKNLKKVVFESILSSIGASFSVAIMTVFWNSIGMNQTAIGFVQMVFTIVICCLDIPMGYIADRFNRKLLNFVGDIGVAVAFLIYAFSQNMYIVLISESLLGVFLAMTNGVDQSFIKNDCDKIDETGELFKKVNIKVHTAQYITMLVATVLGGIIAKFSLRLCIGIAFIPYSLAGIIAFYIEDFEGKTEVKHKNILRDMIYSVKKIIKKKESRIYLASYILGKEITHAQIWIFTPLLIMVGVPIEIVSAGWIVNYIMQIFGGKISEKMIHLKNCQKFIIPVVIEIIWILILVINTNIVTVWLFALNGLVHGLTEGTLITALQETADSEVQTSIVSIASTGARLLYIPLVYIINYLGNIKLQLGLVGVCIIFLPMCIIIYTKIRNLEKDKNKQNYENNFS